MLRHSNLRVLTIKDQPHRVIVSMFTDDTTIYLSEQDNVGDLYQILSLWCAASGAKFNIEKTEIIPIGKKEYRDQVIQSSKPTQTAPHSMTP
ncbi:hypothetical protein ID866_7853 [Astraeus odoratus]|nr:hypothetical protein ID866_7853 [Astraeus odoratus]